MNKTRRVVVTGMGLVGPTGSDEDVFWTNMLAGKTGVRAIASLDTADFKTVCGAEIDDADLADALPPFIPASSDRVTAMALAAAFQALTRAGLRDACAAPPFPPLPIPAIVGTANGPSHVIQDSYESFFKSGPRGPRPTTIPRSMLNAISAQISMQFALTGANYAVVSACTSSTSAIGTAFRMVRHGYADQALCGGAESAFVPSAFSAWNNLGVMSKNPDPATACRPFDSKRDGFVLGEGAAMLVLESLDSAQARGARIRAELCGFGESSDAGHITRPDPQGQAVAIRAALADAQLDPGEVGYINAHGTATKANDACESQSIRLALGDATDRLLVASSKSFFGHLLGAAGAMESLVAILALEQGMVPPNPNLENHDPECAIPLVGREATPIQTDVALKNSFGFGGYNAVLAFRRYRP